MPTPIPEPILEALIEAAHRARQNAHAPYSQYLVGAAVWAIKQIFAGCNVETAAYPVGICAERGALAAAVAHGATAIDALVIVAQDAASPCGMCRQAIAEFGPRIPVCLVSATDGTRIHTDMGTLLPMQFSLSTAPP